MRLSVAVFVIIFVVFGCSSSDKGNGAVQAPGEIQKIQKTILFYNQLLAEGYKSLNMNPLQQAATKEQAEKVYVHMASLGEAKVKMESTLKNMEFKNVIFTGKKTAQVRTKEYWDFRHINIDTKQVVLKKRNFVYELTYELVQEGNRWLVKSIIAKEDDADKGAR